MRPILFNRKSMTWSVHLDMPIGFTPATSPRAAGEVVFGDPGLCHTGPFQPSEAQAWLVVLGVTNSGTTPIRDERFSVPLTFAFPGRQVRRVQISRAQSARAAVTGALPTRVRLHGLRLDRNDELTVTVILAGSPGPDSPRIVQEGPLAGGTIALQPAGY